MTKLTIRLDLSLRLIARTLGTVAVLEIVTTDPPHSYSLSHNCAMAGTVFLNTLNLDTDEAFDVTDHLTYPALHGQLADVHHGHLEFAIQYEDDRVKRFELNHFITLPQLGVKPAPDRPQGWHELHPMHSALQKLCLRIGPECRLLFPRGASCIHVTGVTISAESMELCNRLAWHINFHYHHLLANRPVIMSARDQRLGNSELLATSNATAFAAPFDLPPEWTVLRNPQRSNAREDLPHVFTYQLIHNKVEQFKKKADAIQRRAVYDGDVTLQTRIVEFKDWLTAYKRLLHFAATFHPHYEDFLGASH